MMSDEDAMVDGIYADHKAKVEEEKGGEGGEGQTWTPGVEDVVKA